MPVIVNCILNEHQLVVDIVAFVSKGDFPRSRLGEKQRGKILAGWVTRKMRTIAQFGIRDPDSTDSQITAVPEDRVDRIRNSAHGSITVPENGHAPQRSTSFAGEKSFSRAPTAVSEPPAQYENSIMESPPLNVRTDVKELEDDPLTSHFQQSSNYSPIDFPPDTPTGGDSSPTKPSSIDLDPTPHAELSSFDYRPAPLAPHHSHNNNHDYKPSLPPLAPPQSLMPEGDLWSLPSQKRYSQNFGEYEPRRVSGSAGGGGGLRVANASPDDDSSADDWPTRTMREMNLSSGGGGGGVGGGSRDGGPPVPPKVSIDGRYDGSAYGDAL